MLGSATYVPALLAYSLRAMEVQRGAAGYPSSWWGVTLALPLVLSVWRWGRWGAGGGGGLTEKFEASGV